MADTETTHKKEISPPASRRASGQTSQSGRRTKTAATPVTLPPLTSSAGIPESSRLVNEQRRGFKICPENVPHIQVDYHYTYAHHNASDLKEFVYHRPQNKGRLKTVVSIMLQNYPQNCTTDNYEWRRLQLSYSWRSELFCRIYCVVA